MPNRPLLGRPLLAALLVALSVGSHVVAAPAAKLPWPDLGKAPAKSPGGGAKDAALLVGIERYPFLEDKPVTGAKRNVNDWQLYLTKTRGVPAENVVLLRDDQARREQILRAATDVAGRVQAGGTLWFLFVGHGAPATGKQSGGVLLGVDAASDADALAERGVPQAELMAALGKGKQAHTVAILDACFSGRSASGSTLVAGLQPAFVTKLNAIGAGAVLLAAAQGNEYAGALPGGNRPAFSYLVLGALRGWGDSDGNGKVTTTEAVRYARRALQTLLVGRQQTPDVAGPADGVGFTSSGETGPDLAEWQRQMDEPGDATVPVSVPVPPPVSSHPVATASTCAPNQVLIPGGTFWMGSQDGQANEKPVHRVTLSSYCMDKTEVTVADYRACVQTGACPPASTTVAWKGITPQDKTLYSQFCNWTKGGAEHHPINCVDWTMADTYCKWTGGRLPREAEWEFGARGNDGRAYPWGNAAPNAKLLNACGAECVALGETLGRRWKAIHAGNDGWGSTAPVGSYPGGASPFGLLDMAGNVWEWTSDAYDAYSEQPGGDSRRSENVLRGGGWEVNDPLWVRAAIRASDEPAISSIYRGFRCARDAK